MPGGVFSLIQGGNRAVGSALVQHPAIKAVGFTGSKRAGRMLYDLCAQREDPIPFFGELGAINPMLILPNAAKQNAETLGYDWVHSLTLGAGPGGRKALRQASGHGSRGKSLRVRDGQRKLEQDGAADLYDAAGKRGYGACKKADADSRR